MNKIKSIMATILVVAVVVSATAVSAFASTVDSTDITRNINATSYVASDTRIKDDSSACYLFIKSNPAFTHTMVQATTYTSYYTNLTAVGGNVVSYVVCRTGVQYSVHNMIKERGYSIAALRFKNLSGFGNSTIKFDWSPDSYGTYTDAT